MEAGHILGVHSTFLSSNGISSTIIISHFNVNLDIPSPNTMTVQQGEKTGSESRFGSRNVFFGEHEFARLSTVRWTGSEDTSGYLP